MKRLAFVIVRYNFGTQTQQGNWACNPFPHVTTVNDARSISSYGSRKHGQMFPSASVGSARNLADVSFLMPFSFSGREIPEATHILSSFCSWSGDENESAHSDDQILCSATPHVAVQPFVQTMSYSDRVNLLLTFLADDIPATDNISDDKPRLSSLAQSDYVVPVAPMPRFPFSAITNHFRKIHRDLQPTTVGRLQRFATVPHSKEAIYNPLELSSGDFTFSKDPPVIDRGFSDVSRSYMGGAAHSKKLGAEQCYFRNLVSMLRRQLCMSSSALCALI